MFPQKQYEAHTHTHTHSCSSLLRLIIWCLTDAVQLLCAALLAPFTLHTDVVVHFLGLLLRDAHTVSVIPVGTKVAANVKPLQSTGIILVKTLTIIVERTETETGLIK